MFFFFVLAHLTFSSSVNVELGSEHIHTYIQCSIYVMNIEIMTFINCCYTYITVQKNLCLES